MAENLLVKQQDASMILMHWEPLAGGAPSVFRLQEVSEAPGIWPQTFFEVIYYDALFPVNPLTINSSGSLKWDEVLAQQIREKYGFVEPGAYRVICTP